MMTCLCESAIDSVYLGDVVNVRDTEGIGANSDNVSILAMQLNHRFLMVTAFYAGCPPPVCESCESGTRVSIQTTAEEAVDKVTNYCRRKYGGEGVELLEKGFMFHFP